jgi:hypothetical protein
MIVAVTHHHGLGVDGRWRQGRGHQPISAAALVVAVTQIVAVALVVAARARH